MAMESRILRLVGTAELLLEGNGNGTFQNPVYSNPTVCCEMVAEDINGDGKLDLVRNSDFVPSDARRR